MMFKQRLFTALLGVLFAVALTDHASALYDPGVGRFCSRDPIGYVDGQSLYSNKIGLLGTDPQGTLAIVARYHNHYRPPRDASGCGDHGWANWNFELTPTQRGGGPCGGGSYEGYLIQKVTNYCVAAHCNKPCTCPKSFLDFDDWVFSDDYPGNDVESYTYYEAWKVTRSGIVLGRTSDDFGMTIGAKPDTCGFHHQTGELRYFCKKDVEEEIGIWHQGNPLPKLKPEANKEYGTKCPVTPGSLPSTGEVPDFWRKDLHKAVSDVTERSGTSRFAFLQWNCCGDQKDKWVEFDFGPK
jgi:uncharacterized protein RhaS with RHS repeats